MNFGLFLKNAIHYSTIGLFGLGLNYLTFNAMLEIGYSNQLAWVFGIINGMIANIIIATHTGLNMQQKRETKRNLPA